MAVLHGKSGVFKLDNSTPTLTDLTAFTKDVTFSPDIKVHLTTVFGNNSEQRITGLKDAKLTVNFVNDPTLMTHLVGLYQNSGTARNFEYGPGGTAVGSRKITGTAHLVSFPIQADVTKEETIPASFEVTGDVTFALY